jgi:integrase
MPAERLTDRVARQAKARGMLADGRGLYLRVGPTGAKSWIYRYKVGRKQTDLGLGPYPDVGLAAARMKALALRQQRLNGTDPAAARRADRLRVVLQKARTITFRDCAERYMEAHRAGWRSAHHAQQWADTLANDAYPVLGNLAVASIDTGLVMRVLEPIWKTKTESASRLRGRIEMVLNYATSLGYREGENPARWKGHLEHSLPKPSRVKAPVEDRRHAALPYAEIGAFMAKLRSDGNLGASALEFAILTAARSGEVMGATWSEIDLEHRIWIVPASRIKAGREHRVSLSDAAVTILNRMAEIRTGDFVFPGRRGRMHKDTFPTTLQRLGYNDITAHGFRSTFAQWAAERTNYPHEVREMALAHTVGTAVERAYQRSDLFDRRRRLMDDWATYCAQTATGDVVPLRAV